MKGYREGSYPRPRSPSPIALSPVGMDGDSGDYRAQDPDEPDAEKLRGTGDGTEDNEERSDKGSGDDDRGASPAKELSSNSLHPTDPHESLMGTPPHHDVPGSDSDEFGGLYD